MAFQMAVSKSVAFQSTPLSFPNAYWVATFTALDKIHRTATVVFLAYADQATRNALSAQPVDSHSISVSGDTFDTYFSDAAMTTSNAYAQAYVMARAVADSPRGPRQQSNAATIFFANATSV